MRFFHAGSSGAVSVSYTGRRGRAFADGTRVEERLERLCDPAKCGVASVIEYGKFLDNSELVNGHLSWGWCFRFHLRV